MKIDARFFSTRALNGLETCRVAGKSSVTMTTVTALETGDLHVMTGSYFQLVTQSASH